MANDKVIYLKDALKDKTPTDILAMMPFMVCIEELNDNDEKDYHYKDYKSCNVLGVSNTQLLLDDRVWCSGDEDEFGPGAGSYENSYISLKIKNLRNRKETYPDGHVKTINFIFCNPATDKQKEFVIKYCNWDKDKPISGYHAYHLIADKTQEWKKQKEERQNAYRNYGRRCGLECDEDDYDYNCPYDFSDLC